MGLIRGKQEFRSILDFSAENISKNFVKQSLREVEIEGLVRSESGHYTYIENQITVGMYQIQLSFQSVEGPDSKSKLKDRGSFRVAIYEQKRSNVLKNINLDRDKRFSHQYWVKLNHQSDIKINSLADIIVYLHRLDRLKLFL